MHPNGFLSTKQNIANYVTSNCSNWEYREEENRTGHPQTKNKGKTEQIIVVQEFS